MARRYADLKLDIAEEARRQQVWEELSRGDRRRKYTLNDFLAGSELFNTGACTVERESSWDEQLVDDTTESLPIQSPVSNLNPWRTWRIANA